MEKSTSDAAGKDSDLSNLAAALQASVLDEDDLPPTIPSGGGLPVPVSFGSLGKIPSRQNSTGLGDKGQHESTTSAISPAMNGSYLQCQVPTGPNLFSAYTADVWAAGVTLFCFLFGRVPFEAENPKELFELVLACQPNYELDAEGRKEDNSQGEPPSKGSISQDALTILQGILERDPAVRWDLHHIERAVVEWKDRVSWVSSQHSSA
jgi:serine/threonine protein kinase